MLRFFSILLLSFFALNAFAQPGSLDPAFGAEGKVTALPEPVFNKFYGIVEQSDHKILAGGYSLSGTAHVFTLLRFLPDGSLDVDFGANGVVETPVGADAVCFAIALQTDGKILLAGGAALTNTGNMDFAVVRYLANGYRDSTFSADGIQFVFMGSGNDVVRSVAVQPDGKIVLCGTSNTNTGSVIGLARLKPDGNLDNTFSVDGKATLAIGPIFTTAYAMALQSDGKIVVVGDAKFGMGNDIAVARFLTDGTPDPAFSGGFVTKNTGSDGDGGNAVAIQPDGKIMVAGISGASRDFTLLQYLSNGSPDPEFGTQGLVITDFNGSDDYANGIVIQPDGKIVAGGYASTNAIPDFALARYLSDGTLDSTFGIAGKVITDFDGGYDYGFPLLLQNDGKLLLGGYAFSSGHTGFAAARYLSGLTVGTLDFSKPVEGFIAPNPVSSSAIFEFETPDNETFTLKLFSTEGRCLHTFFVNKKYPAGKFTETLLFPENLPAGWYVLQMMGAQHQLNIRMLKR